MPPRTTVFFDLETGGIEPDSPVIQIAAIAIRQGRELGVFERKILFNEWQADRKALEVNSYDPDQWARQACNEAQAVAEFARFLRQHADIEKVGRSGKAYRVARLGGHNALAFDLPRIRELYERHGEFFPGDSFAVLDTLHLATWALATNGDRSPTSLKLTVIAEHFGIPHSGAHDALHDVRINIQVAEKLLRHFERPRRL